MKDKILNREKKKETGSPATNTFERLFNEYYLALCAFAQHYINDSNLAEDIVQEVFLTLLKNKEELSYIQHVRSFLYTSVKNRCVNEIKHRRVISKYAESEMQEKENDNYFVDSVIEEETHRLIYRAINELPPKCKEIAFLSLEGMNNIEIADRLKISVNTVKTQKKIAYRQLRIDLKHLLSLSPFILHQFFN